MKPGVEERHVQYVMGEKDPHAHNTSGVRSLSFSSSFLFNLLVGSS